MTETKKDKIADDDPRLAGHALQDHDRVKAEIEGNPTRSEPDRAPRERDEALEEVRDVRAANEERTRRHTSVAIEERVAASTTSGTDKFIDVSTVDGRVYINTHGEAVLDGDGCTNLQHILAKAKQAVS